MSYPNPYGQYTTSDMYGSNPPTPHSQQQDPGPPGGFPQWETLDHQHDQQEFQQAHSPLDTTPVPTPTSTSFHNMQLELEEPPHMVPSHQSPVDDTPILLHHPHEIPQQQQHQLQHHPGSATGPLLFHPSAPPTPGPSGTSTSSTKPPTGAVRSTSSSRGRATTATHPYYRSSATGAAFMTPGVAAGQSPASSSGSSSRPAQARKPTVRFSGTTAHGGMVPRPTTRSTSGSMASPAVPSPTSRLGFLAGSNTNSPQTHQHHSFSPQDSTHTPQTPLAHQFTPQNPQSQAQPQTQGSPAQATHSPIRQPTRRVTHHILSDMHYDDREYTLTASLELPGVTYDNLHVTLGTCYFNHVKYVGVTAETTPPFPPPEWSADLLQAVRAEMERGIAGAAAAGFEKIRAGRIVNPNLRERKFGIMRRMIQVPGHTTMEDITASLKDGVLTLRIYCGKPFELDDEQEVPVRLG